jgi:hypothetical protein
MDMDKIIKAQRRDSDRIYRIDADIYDLLARFMPWDTKRITGWWGPELDEWPADFAKQVRSRMTKNARRRYTELRRQRRQAITLVFPYWDKDEETFR